VENGSGDETIAGSKSLMRLQTADPSLGSECTSNNGLEKREDELDVDFIVTSLSVFTDCRHFC